MSGQGDSSGIPEQRSRLTDYAAMADSLSQSGIEEQSPASQIAVAAHSGSVVPALMAGQRDRQPSTDPLESPEGARIRRRFAALLGEFRRTAVLVPLGDGPGADEERGVLTGDWNGIRWIYAFSDEAALARFAVARGEAAREWTYQRILGARLLDVAVPAAGVPCGVALDAADGEDGMVFPPVKGIVPDAVAVDVGDEGERRA
ncbi:hypothetical protein [Streptomyces sp. NPDC001415]